MGLKHYSERDPDDNVTGVVLVRREDRLEPYPGSIEWTADCGHECWVGPALVKMMANLDQKEEVRSMCIQCMAEMTGQPEILELIPRFQSGELS